MKALRLVSTDKASPYFLGDLISECSCLSFDYKSEDDQIIMQVIFEHDEEADFTADFCRTCDKFESIDFITVVSSEFAEDFLTNPPANSNTPILEG